MDELLCIGQGEFGDVPEVVESCLTEVFEVSWGSILPHRLVTDVERKMFWPEKVIQVMVEERS